MLSRKLTSAAAYTAKRETTSPSRASEPFSEVILSPYVLQPPMKINANNRQKQSPTRKVQTESSRLNASCFCLKTCCTFRKKLHELIGDLCYGLEDETL